MAIYYADSINGLDTNDGLTPGGAFDSPFTAPDGVENDETIVYVRNTSTYTLAESKNMKYKKIIFWPTALEFGYSERPQLGIDDGWDGDTPASSIDLATYRLEAAFARNSTLIANTRVYSDSTDNRYGFNCYGGTFHFNNCVIDHKCTSTSYPFLRTRSEPDDDSFIFFTDCTLYSDSSMVWMEHYDSSRTLTFERCDISGNRVTYSSTSNSDSVVGETTVNIINTTINVTNVLFEKKRDRTFNKTVNVVSSTVVADNFIDTDGASYYYPPSIKLDIKYSEFTLTNYFMNFISGYSRHAYYKDIDIYKSSIDAKNFMFTRGDSTSYYTYSQGVINLINCSLSFSAIFEIYETNKGRVQNFKGINIVNCSLIGKNQPIPFLKIHSQTEAVSRIELDGFSSNGTLLYNVGEVDLTLTNSNIGGDILVASSPLSKLYLNNVTGGKIDDCGSLEVDNSTLSSDEQLFNDIRYGVVKNSTLTSKLPINPGGKLFIIDSTLLNDMMSEIDGELKIYNTAVNSTTVAYEARKGKIQEKLSPVFRLGGSSGALNLISSLNEPMFSVFDEVRGLLSPGNTVATVYMCSNSVLSTYDLKGIYAQVTYTKLDGSKSTSVGVVSHDTTSLWDGVLQSSYAIKIECPIVAAEIDYTEKVYASVGIKLDANISKDLYFDLDLGGA